MMWAPPSHDVTDGKVNIHVGYYTKIKFANSQKNRQFLWPPTHKSTYRLISYRDSSKTARERERESDMHIFFSVRFLIN